MIVDIFIKDIMKNLNLNTGNGLTPTTPNGDAGRLCLGSEASGW